jgi:hypothetical protein
MERTENTCPKCLIVCYGEILAGGYLQVCLGLKPGRLLILALDHILLRALDNLCELLAGLGVVLEQVVLDQSLGCLTHPLEEREVLELICSKAVSFYSMVAYGSPRQGFVLPARKISRTSSGSSSLRFSMKWPMLRGTMPTSPAM